jgi:hypothetical protein
LRAVDAPNGGMEAQNGAVESLWTNAWPQIRFDEDSDLDPH